MSARRLREIAVVVINAGLLLAPVGALVAQPSCAQEHNPWVFLRNCARSAFPRDSTTLPAAFREAFQQLKSPTTLNSALGEAEGLARLNRRLGSLQLQFVNVQEGDTPRLGIQYDWTKDLVRSPFHQGMTHRGLVTELASAGVLVGKAEENPVGVIFAGLNAYAYASSGGKVDATALDSQLRSLADTLARTAATAGAGSPSALTAAMGSVWDRLTTQSYASVGPELRFETNQAGDQTQWVVGARAGLDLKAWRPTSAGARLNVFDWPAAAIRFLTGTDQSFTPSGAAIPTVEVALHRVSPLLNAGRDSLGALAAHNRVVVTALYRSRLANAREGPFWLEASFRYHREVAPSDAVLQAGLHRRVRLLVSITGPGGVNVWWSGGSLPLDDDPSDILGIGYRFHFK